MNSKKRYLLIFLLTLSALCYNLPYLSSTFYTQFLEAFSLSNTQAGLLLTMFSLTATPGYLFGGMLADKFSPKKLIILSQLMTAALVSMIAAVGGSLLWEYGLAGKVTVLSDLPANVVGLVISAAVLMVSLFIGKKNKTDLQ